VVSSTPRPHFTPREDPVPILQEAGWATGPVWTGGKSRPHQDSIPDRPARRPTLSHCTYNNLVNVVMSYQMDAFFKSLIKNYDNQFYNTNVLHASLKQHSKFFSLMLGGSQSRSVKECIYIYILLKLLLLALSFEIFRKTTEIR
jgi:hypothetical protein